MLPDRGMSCVFVVLRTVSDFAMSPRFSISSLLVLIALPAAALGEMSGVVPTVTAHADYSTAPRAEARPAVATPPVVAKPVGAYGDELQSARAEAFVLSNSERIELREQITAAAAEIYASEGGRGVPGPLSGRH